jgi:hypothetical protein
MIFPVIDLIFDPESYVCHWRDGELYVEAAAQPQ